MSLPSTSIPTSSRWSCNPLRQFPRQMRMSSRALESADRQNLTQNHPKSTFIVRFILQCCKAHARLVVTSQQGKEQCIRNCQALNRPTDSSERTTNEAGIRVVQQVFVSGFGCSGCFPDNYTWYDTGPKPILVAHRHQPRSTHWVRQ
jgi:hypothetical protein